MGSDSNRLRRKWQDYSGTNAGVSEMNFFEIFRELFVNCQLIHCQLNSPAIIQSLYGLFVFKGNIFVV
jgi:hypothetical protein